VTGPEAAATPIIRGDRVYLRPAERSDIATFVRWLNDAETSVYLSAYAPLSNAMEERWFEDILARQGQDAYFFVACLLADSRPIGTVSLFRIDRTNGNAGVGIMIGEKDLLGQGLGSAAMNAIVDFGFGMLRLERIWLDVYDFNERARRMYDRIGFSLEGSRRHGAYRHGKYIDEQLMSILRDEWTALPRKKSWEIKE
jgi:RimJ/RimL family protein N-acetyltransferase